MSALTIEKTIYTQMWDENGDSYTSKPSFHIIIKNHKQLPQKGEWIHELDIGPFGSEEAAQNFIKREAKAIKLTQTRTV